jgi:hypothetical protein
MSGATVLEKILLVLCVSVLAAGVITGAIFVLLRIFCPRVFDEKAEQIDNPRCYCPDCGADMGFFYNNRIVLKREPEEPTR